MQKLSCYKWRLLCKRRIVFEKERQQLIMHDVHEGLGDHPKAKVSASHRDSESTYQKICQRFYWHNIAEDVKSYIKTCEQRQKQRKIARKYA